MLSQVAPTDTTLRSDPAYRVGYYQGHLDGRAESAREIRNLRISLTHARDELADMRVKLRTVEQQRNALFDIACDTDRGPSWPEIAVDVCARAVCSPWGMAVLGIVMVFGVAVGVIR